MAKKKVVKKKPQKLAAKMKKHAAKAQAELKKAKAKFLQQEKKVREYIKKNPQKAYSNFLKKQNKILILRWASDNNIDETSFKKIKFLYYSK